MRNVLLLLLFGLVITTGCVSTRAGEESRFQRVELQKEKMEVGGLLLPSAHTYHLTDNAAIAFFLDTTVGEHTLPGLGPSTFWGPEWVMFLVDTDSNRVTCRSELSDIDEWWLNIYKTGQHMFILREDEGEFYTFLSLFVFNKTTKTCSYAGTFDVHQYFDEEVDTSPYPIEGIYVEESDTLVSFKFTKKLWLMESDTSSRVADSLTYELDLRTDSLRVAKIWMNDTLR